MCRFRRSAADNHCCDSRTLLLVGATPSRLRSDQPVVQSDYRLTISVAALAP